MLNQGNSAADIYKLLSSVKRFKQFLPKEAQKAAIACSNGTHISTSVFQVPALKRKKPEGGKKDTNPSPLKKNPWAAFKPI